MSVGCNMIVGINFVVGKNINVDNIYVQGNVNLRGGMYLLCIQLYDFVNFYDFCNYNVIDDDGNFFIKFLIGMILMDQNVMFFICYQDKIFRYVNGIYLF